jgi:proteasome assembly chaperone (PAC2) family protein
MQPLIWESRPDGLRAPALVAAFSGWNDAGDAASAALTFIGESLGAERFARLDPEEFYDFQSTRPHIGFTADRTREITWPGIEIFAARVPRAPRDLILVQGPEPSMRWQTFCRHIVDLAEVLGTQLVVTMGALLADVPHTQPVAITGLASDESLVAKLGTLTETTYEGPTGIVGVLHTACSEAGLPSASLWASVPHYVAAAPNPKAALALVRKVETLVAVNVDGPREGDERVRASGRARGPVRPRRAGVRRAPRAGRPAGRGAARAGRRAVRRRARQRVPALPAPAGPRRALAQAADGHRVS